MKRGILFYLLAFSAACLTGGELVPLQQYRKSVFRINPVPDRYLFEATAILAASEFFKGDEKGGLSEREQFKQRVAPRAREDDVRAGVRASHVPFKFQPHAALGRGCRVAFPAEL